MPHLAVQQLGIDAQVPHAKRLEQRPERAKVIQEPPGRSPQHGRRDRWIDELAFRRGTNRQFRLERRRPGRDILHQEYLPQRIQIRRQRLLAESRVIGLQIPQDGFRRGQRRDVPRQRFEQVPHTVGIALDAIHPMNVLVNDFIDVAGRLNVRRPWRLGEHSLRPSSAAHEVCKLVNANAGMAGHLARTLKKRRKGNLPCRVARFPETHRTHPHPDNPPRASMPWRFLFLLLLAGDSRSCQYELPVFAAFIHKMPHGIP